MTAYNACLLLCMAGGSASGKQGQPGFLFGWLLIMIGLFYFVLIRPQQRKEKERKKMISEIKSGSHVIFSGGIIGIVTNVKDRVFTIKIADNTKIDVVREAITKVLEKGEKLSSDLKEI